jgi:hypothetical protein
LKNHNPAGRRLRFASAGQRVLSVLVLAMFGALVWAAWSGRFDSQVNQVASWMQARYEALAN